MTAKNYFFTIGPAANKDERAQNDVLGFTFVNGAFGSTFSRKCGKVAGLVPEHLKDKEVDLPEIEITESKEVDLPEIEKPKKTTTAKPAKPKVEKQ